MHAGRGNDFVSVNEDGDVGGDYVDCGPGLDTVNRMPALLPDDTPPIDPEKDVFVNCEEFAS